MSNENRLGSLVHRKGAAPRPTEIPQRGEPVAVAIAPTEAEANPTSLPEPKAKRERKPKPVSLTLKLSPEQYERLRIYAFQKRTSHQTVIETALLRHLDEEGA
jgi:hypothetical protein